MGAEVIILVAAIVVTIVTAVIIVRFGFYLRDRSAYEMETVSDTVIDAMVLQKYVVESQSSEQPFAGILVFRCRDGRDVHLRVDNATYKQAVVGQMGELVHRGKIFLGFGEPSFSDQPSNGDGEEEMGFSFTGFDERIDQEIPMGYTKQDVAFLDGKEVPPEEQKMYRRFRQREQIPRQMIHMRAEMDTLESFPVLQLLARSEAPSFLKAEPKLQSLFERTYTQALMELQKNAGEERRGAATDSISLRGNRFTLEMVMQEFPKPEKHQIAARLLVNIKVAKK